MDNAKKVSPVKSKLFSSYYDRSGHTEIVGPTILVTRASCSLSLLCPVEFLPYQPLLGRHTGNCSGPLVVKGTRNSFKKQTEP